MNVGRQRTYFASFPSVCNFPKDNYNRLMVPIEAETKTFFWAMKRSIYISSLFVSLLSLHKNPLKEKVTNTPFCRKWRITLFRAEGNIMNLLPFEWMEFFLDLNEPKTIQ